MNLVNHGRAYFESDLIVGKTLHNKYDNMKNTKYFL